jgi:prophage tail gpP-like protein
MKVTLRTPSGEYNWWKTIRITRSMEQTTGEFSLEVTEYNQPDLLKHHIKTSDRCQVLINNTVVIDGYVEVLEASYDSKSHSITVAGRDITGDLMDTSAELPNGELANVKMDALARELVKNTAISIDCPNAGEPFDKAVVSGGETIFEVLRDHASQRALLLYTLGDGVLHIAKPPQTELHKRLIEGINILSAKASHDSTSQFGRYVFHAQGKEGKTETLTVTDPNSRPSRVLVQDVELAESSSLNLQTRANWELKVRAAKGRRANIMVQGWEHTPNEIWNVGQRVHLISPRLGYDQVMLIISLTYTVSDNAGHQTELTLVDPAAYDIEPT